MGKTLGYGEITVANMTEPFTVMLTNEAQQFATDSNRKVTSAQSYYTDIIVIRGSQERTDYTIGNITSGSGITVSKSSKRVTFSVSAGATIGADTGVIEIPITLDGQTVKKQFSWSLGKQGIQGVKGTDGNSFAWNMLSETNCGKKHWETASSGGKYSVESETTEDNIEAVKLICTESVSSSEWSYTCFRDLEMLKQLKPSTKYTLSYDIKANRSGAISHSIYKGDASNFCTNIVVVNNIIGNETWQHISVVLTTNDLKTTPTNEILYLGRNALSKVGYSIIKNLKLVEGDIDTPWSPSQSDIEGKGVVETVQYYLATSQASGVTSSTSGWSTDITTQKLTTDKKYLWNCYQTKYSDGTSEPISTPKVIGVYGDKGQKGDNAKNLFIAPSSQYFKSTDGGKTFAPNTITIKPTIQGEISFGKWQYSIDGGVSFADVVSGQKGLTVSNNVLAVSKDSSLYSDAVTMVTFRAVANDSSFYDTCSIAKIYDVSDIGDGRNLLTGVSSYTKNTPFEKTDSRADGWIVYQNIITSIELEAGKKYVLQAKTDGNWAANHNTNGQDPSKKLVTLWLVSDKTNDCFDMRQGYVVFTPTVTAKYKLRVNQYSNGTDAYTIHLWDIKLEKGSSPTGWTPAPEDVQTAILSTKSEISDVSLKVDKNKQAIEQRVEKTTYQQDLTLVKGDISKANEGLNKWRYEIYPKSLFASEYQGKSTMDVFAKNTNLTPSQSVLINDTDFGKNWAYGDNYIGYALTFVKFSAAKSVAITFKHDDGAHLYLNGKLIGGDDTCNTGSGESLTLSFIQGWNCLEVVLNEKSGGEYIGLGTTISAISECQLMNCYYGTPVARQSHITNQLVKNTTDIDGVSGSVQKVMSTVGGSGKIDEFVNNYSTWKNKVDNIETRVGKTYTTKDDFNGLEIGGRNLLTKDDCNMSKWQNLYPAHCKITNNDYSNHVDYIPTGSEWEIVYKKISITKGQKYILSFDYKVNKAYSYLSGQKYGVYLSTSVPTNAAPTNIITDGQYVIENTVTNIKRGMITFTATVDTLYVVINGGCIDDNQTGLSFEFNKWKLEKGNKATDWSPAPEDDEINGQNLVSNLPSNWEQGSFVVEDDSKNKTYSEVKVSEKTQIRIKELIPVFGDITISAQTTQSSSKEALNHYVMLFDVNKRYMGKHNVNGWNTSFPRMFNCGDARYIAIALKWGDGTKTQIAPSDISQICLKIERGTSATAFTLAPEDVNGRINSVETIATQTATEIGWLINRNGSTASSLKLTENALTAIAENINLTGRVKFSSLSADAKQGILNSFEVGGRNLLVQKNITEGYLSTDGKGSFIGSGGGDQTSDWIDVSGNKYITITLYEDFTNTNNSGRYCEYDADKNCINTVGYNPRQKSSIIIELKSNTKYIRVTAIECKTRRYKIEKGNKATDWTPAPEDVSQDATNKASQALTDAKNYSSSAVDWVTNNGSSTTNLNSMVKEWTDGAVSDTAQINGGWIKANTITASKIAIGDFTNYADINESNTYWFRVEQTKEGTWFYRDGSELQRDNVISELHTCRGGETFYVEYDISNTIKEGDEYKYAGLMIFGYDGNGGIVSYNRNAGVTATANGEITHITTQLTMPDTTRSFRVYLQIEGHVPFTGTLKIRNISIRKAVTGTLIVDGSITADKIATDAIKSRNYISSGGTQGSFLNLSDGSFTSPNLSWDSNGNLIAKNANLSGQITATKGKIGSFNLDKSLYLSNNSPYYFSQFCAKKVYGLTNEGDIYIGSEGIYSYSWETGNMYIGDSGSIQADVSSSRGVCIENGEIYIYKSDYCKDYPTACDNKYGLVLAGGYVASANYSDGGSIDGFNFILTPNKFNINGKIYASNELQTGGDQIRIISGNIGCMVRNDSADFYILRTNSGDPYGGWTNDRPFRINWASNDITCGHNLTANDLIANSWVYCSEVHSSGAVVIASNSESYYWAHGYQMARGTSWGGVCIGDDSQGLRLYGTSIWASHSISTSDENLKENFTTLDQYEDFYMNLNPIGFNYIGDYDGKKTHFGFGAHKTEDILESEGYDSDKFAVVTHRPLVQEDIEKRFGKDVEVDIETEYGVSYTEFIALNTHMIQKTRKELEQVKQEKTDLEARLQAIEAKLGL